MTNKQIIEAYPKLEETDIHQVIEYAAWLADEYHRPLKAAMD
ncbi:DUF433 domain-containing protein [candidate division KSB1 bacterium]|nr:DUF433 domain-containing protein [candidate division KSB1 bacterium]